MDFLINATVDDTPESIAEKIFSQVILRPIKNNKPYIIVMTGKSGEGKSWSALKIQDILYHALGLDFLNYLRICVVMSPKDYAEKLTLLLNDKEYKKAFSIHLDEARIIVGAETWNSFVNHSIAHVNAMSRAVKPLVIIIITQSLRDIDNNTRSTVNMQIKVRRLGSDSPVLVPYAFWVDDHNVDKPVLRRKRLFGIVRYPSGDKIRLLPKFKFRPPRKELIDIYETMMLECKTSYIDARMKRLLDRINKDMNKNSTDRIEGIVATLFKYPDELQAWGSWRGKKYVFNPEFAAHLNLDTSQVKDLEKRMMKKRGDQIEKEAVENGAGLSEASEGKSQD